MATSPNTADEILEVLQGLNVRVRKMFGEYGLYCDERVVGFICDDQVFMKITDAGVKLIFEPVYAPAYPGSKDYLLIDHDSWYEGGFLPQLVQTTADELPAPKPKKPKAKKG